MKAKLVNAILFFDTEDSVQEGVQILFGESIEFSSGIVLQKREKTALSVPNGEWQLGAMSVAGLTFGKEIEFRVAPTPEEILEAKNYTPTYEKLKGRPITENELQLMLDYLSLEQEGKKGCDVGVQESNFLVYDVSENIKKVVLSEMYLCDKETDPHTDTIISQYSINEGVVYFENDFMTTEDSGDIDISDITDML
jgi:hypothetical protein